MKEENIMYKDKINHFSIRKLSIGAASVLLSTTLYFGLNFQTPTVHAKERKLKKYSILSTFLCIMIYLLDYHLFDWMQEGL